MRLALALILALAAPMAAYAAGVPTPGVLDPRIQTVDYDPDQVVLLQGTLGYQFMIEFGQDEKIQTVSIGDALGWQVTPNRNAGVLFLKPIDRGSATNMTVLTDQRRYAFELQVAPPASTAPILYIARMTYPQPVMAAIEPAAPPAPEAPPTVANSSYSMTGSLDGRPARIFDDGKMTYFEWPPQASTPAIFAAAADGSESLVDYVVRGPYVVVEQLGARFMLRNGKSVITVVNQAALPSPARTSDSRGASR